MIINVTNLWRSQVFPNLVQHLPQQFQAKTAAMNDKIVQNSFYLPEGCKIKWVGNLDSNEPKELETYDDVPEYELTAEEKAKVQGIRAGLTQNDPQIFIDQVGYDEATKTLYLVPKKADYAFFKTLSLDEAKGGFATNSPIRSKEIYKTGIMTPIITNDGYTFFMERARGIKFFSVPGGFLQVGKDVKLDNLLNDTALAELEEELTLQLSGSEKTRIPIIKAPQIHSVSFREGNKGEARTIEFIAPVTLGISAKELEQIIKNNKAKDASEHTGESVGMEVNKDKIVGTLCEGEQRLGWFLYGPSACCALADCEGRMDFDFVKQFAERLHRQMEGHNLDDLSRDYPTPQPVAREAVVPSPESSGAVQGQGGSR